MTVWGHSQDGLSHIMHELIHVYIHNIYVHFFFLLSHPLLGGRVVWTGNESNYTDLLGRCQGCGSPKFRDRCEITPVTANMFPNNHHPPISVL